MHYTPDEKGNPVPEPDPVKWRRWLEAADLCVALEGIGGCEVSTVFLGLDRGGGGASGLKLRETMIFGGRLDDVTVRCSGPRGDAQAMHAEVVKRVRETAVPEKR